MNCNIICIFVFIPVFPTLPAMMIGDNIFQFSWYQSPSRLVHHLKDEKHPLLCQLLQLTLFHWSRFSFSKHFKINLFLTVGLNFENGVATFWVLFTNFVFFVEGRPTTVVSASLFRPFFNIFDGMIIVGATSTAGFSCDSSLVNFSFFPFSFPPQNHFQNTKICSSLTL